MNTKNLVLDGNLFKEFLEIFKTARENIYVLKNYEVNVVVYANFTNILISNSTDSIFKICLNFDYMGCIYNPIINYKDNFSFTIKNENINAVRVYNQDFESLNLSRDIPDDELFQLSLANSCITEKVINAIKVINEYKPLIDEGLEWSFINIQSTDYDLNSILQDILNERSAFN